MSQIEWSAHTHKIVFASCLSVAKTKIEGSAGSQRLIVAIDSAEWTAANCSHIILTPEKNRFQQAIIEIQNDFLVLVNKPTYK